mmetsp:Transcript_68797/g.222993  ORF Transcript_68797/g.222993 Transcript_68797/m.222993 type:complete len:121 (+) Transcript_68797:48-410(+)
MYSAAAEAMASSVAVGSAQLYLQPISVRALRASHSQALPFGAGRPQRRTPVATHAASAAAGVVSAAAAARLPARKGARRRDIVLLGSGAAAALVLGGVSGRAEAEAGDPLTAAQRLFVEA